MKNCVICGAALVLRSGESAQRFAKRETCSRPCRDRLSGQRLRVIPDPRTCAICGVSFAIRDNEVAHNFLKRMTCSQHCKGIRLNRVKRARMIRERAEGLEIGQVPLANGMIALVDPGDYDRVMQHLWRARQAPDSDRWYAYSVIEGARSSLHRFVLGTGKGALIDHWNRDGLDCRRHNLRHATHSQNSANQRLRVDNKSGYRGVRLFENGSWRAMIGHQGRTIHIGLYATADEAAQAYDARARELHGSFARLNFPEAGEQPAEWSAVQDQIERQPDAAA